MNARKSRNVRLAAGVAGVALLAAACSGGGSTKPTDDPSALPKGSAAVKLDPADFSTTIDNPYMPLIPGTQSTFREVDTEGEVSTIVLTVTDKTQKMANGITALVVRDTATSNGSIIEDTFDWYAQDKDGNVWYLGEDTAEFDNGKKISTEGSFEAGVDKAMPGIAMPADPRPGLSYRQEYYKGHAEDNGEIVKLGEQAEVALGHYDDVLVTKDTVGLEPDVVEYKFFAPGVGMVLALDISGGNAREELISVKKVSAGTATGPLGQP